MPEEDLETAELKEQIEEGVERALEAKEKRERGEGREGRENKERAAPRWTTYLSLQTAVIAVFAAVAALESGGNSNEAILEKNEAILFQSRASDKWAHYQAKGIKQSLAANEAMIISATNATLAAKLEAEARRYQGEQTAIEAEARELEAKVEESNKRSAELLEHHHRFASAVTLFQIAIALSAIAALTRRKVLWFVGLAGSAAGVVLFVRGLVALL